jgi:hypothetical protein
LLARILRTMSATFSVDNRFFIPRYKPLFYLLFSLFPIFQPILVRLMRGIPHRPPTSALL